RMYYSASLMATPSQRGSALRARPLTRRASHVYGLAVAVAALGALSTGAGVLDVLRGVDVQSAHVAHLRVLGERLTAPAIIAAARGLCDALFFLPVLRRLTERYCALAELSADEAAVSSLDGDAAPLASAMLTFGEAADPAVVGIAPERVDHLLGRSPGWGLP